MLENTVRNCQIRFEVLDQKAWERMVKTCKKTDPRFMSNLARLERKWIENYRQVPLGGWMLDKSLKMNATAEGMFQYALVWDMVIFE